MEKIVEFLEFVKTWVWNFLDLFQGQYHIFKDDLGLIPEAE